jgi:hypothetical protein
MGLASSASPRPALPLNSLARAGWRLGASGCRFADWWVAVWTVEYITVPDPKSFLTFPSGYARGKRSVAIPGRINGSARGAWHEPQTHLIWVADNEFGASVWSLECWASARGSPCHRRGRHGLVQRQQCPARERN